MEHEPILSTIDPEIADRIISRREMIAQGAATTATAAAGLALASIPVALATFARETFAQGTLPQNIIDVLNFALTLEYLESEFYTTGTGMPGLIPGNVTTVFDQIRKHEVAHVAFLKSVLGAAAVAKPTFDFTAGGGSGHGPYADVFSNYETFKAVSQAFEDTGVRAYKGQATNLMSSADVLTAALQIHSVEARHAAEVRRLRGLDSWILNSMTNIPGAGPVYGAGNPPSDFPSEDNTVQGGFDVFPVAKNALSCLTKESVTAAFDEPLDKGTVLAIVKPFIAA